MTNHITMILYRLQDHDITKAGKEPRTAAANGKPVSGKLSLVSTKLVQDELPPGSPKARTLEDSSDQNDNDVRLPLVKANIGLKTAAANGKLVNGKLSSASTKLALKIGQDVRAKKLLTLKTS